MKTRPVVGVSADLKLIDPHEYHCVGHKYLNALIEVADALPVMLPAVTTGIDTGEILRFVDGILLTGSYTNLHPEHYEGGDPVHDHLLDPERDAANMRLIPAAIEAGVPLFGICRGHQEMNVALGGSLHQQVHEEPGYDYHLEDADSHLDEQYGPSHPVYLSEGGLLASLSDSLEQTVNSLHAQGIDRLADGVTVEARAADGLVESFSVPDAAGFTLAVQWHPEWKPATNPFYTATWRAFGAACRKRAANR